MAKIKRGYTRKEPSIPKASPHKDIPVLTKKMPDRPSKSPRGSKYRPSKSSGLAAFHSSERDIANAENKVKQTGPKISKIRQAFARVPLAAFRLGGGGGGGAGRK